MHQDTMKEIFERIEKRLPIWVFLASIAIISSAFAFVGYLNQDSKKDLVKKIDETSVEIKQLSQSLHDVNISQAVVLFRLEELAKRNERIDR